MKLQGSDFRAHHLHLSCASADITISVTTFAVHINSTINLFSSVTALFFHSEADPKGSDCYEKFSVMQECMSQYPELYGKDEDEDLAAALDTAGGEASREEGGGGDQDRAGEGK